MDLVFSPEQEELRRSVRRFLDDKSPTSAVRALMEDVDGYDPAVWKQMAGQLGLHGLTIPEEYGGSGFGFVELVIVLEEMGRSLVPAPYFSTVVLAAQAILDSGDTAAAGQLLPGIADGSTIATLAFTEDSGRWDLDGIALSAAQSGSGWTLTGAKSYVVDGHLADLVLVAARTPGGLSLFAVDGNAPGLTKTALPTLDQTRKLARLEFDEVEGRLVGTEGSAAEGLTRTLDKVAVALAAEQVGGAQQVLEMAVEYAKVRYQFGRPIGSFQAIKHLAADVLLQVESAKSAAYYAAWAAAEDSEELPVVASLAKAYCSDAYFFAAAENIQIHGGIGFTWEHDAHLYFKRAKSTQLFLGDSAFHRERLAQKIGI
jgi:alkylation response protein AidB-like acyl-CoA dehydrogenase